MSHKEIIRQLEFFRDIGVTSLAADTLGNGAHGNGAGEQNGAHGNTARTKAAPALAPPAPAQSSSVTETLASIHEDIGDCQRCKLAPTRTHIVFGSGNPNAELVFVGEAPGADEDEQGLPFVGRAGQLLTNIIASIDPGNITREDVYICNILKCRPPGNRNPEPDEVRSCSPFLKRQLAVIRPKIVCCLGTFAAQTVLQTAAPISRLRGKFFDMDGMRVIA